MIEKKESLLNESQISSYKDITNEKKNNNKSINSLQSMKKDQDLIIDKKSDTKIKHKNNKNEFSKINENNIENERNINIKKQMHLNLENSKEKQYLLNYIEERSDGALLEIPYIGIKGDNSILSNEYSYN